MNVEKAVEDFLNGISEGEKAYFVGTTVKNPVEYKVGEEIIFRIRVKCAEGYLDVPFVKYSLAGDDGRKSEGYAEKAEDGWFYISTSLERDGFVRLIATACDKDKNKLPSTDIFEGGAGADVEKIVTGTQVPEDYFEFWEWLKTETYKVEPEVIYDREVEIEKYPDYKFHDMRIKVTDDMYASCMVSYPKGAKEGTLKLKCNYRGYGVNGITEIEGMPNTMYVITNAHSIPNDETEEYYANIKATVCYRYGFIEEENKDPKTTYWAKMFMRNLQSFRYFSNHPLVNKKDYIFTGGSQGAMQACSMAVHSGVATECELFVPWFADLGAGVNLNRMVGWRPEYANGLRYFDTAIAAKFLKCPVSISAGLGDYICPPSGQMALYNGITAKKHMIFIQNKTHSYNPVERIEHEVK